MGGIWKVQNSEDVACAKFAVNAFFNFCIGKIPFLTGLIRQFYPISVGRVAVAFGFFSTRHFFWIVASICTPWLRN